ncbi:MAG: hypothetical protein CFH30_00670 [Alphaproteobacteria bacterium MarineAlpha8_Bin1]|nr:MAG: hypothetical protein CFH30_00670 [Alphaproteobacteria bacterium MarineAlpha8_Bin1]|tara:strand:+ start:727 stop:1095 length:369 start_codon:yes stop_codon:yes gene_type:complete
MTFDSLLSNEIIKGEGIVLRVLNKITTQKVYIVMPLSQKLELDNSEIIIYSCLRIENEGIPDEIALMKHTRRNENKSKDFLGWIFRSSKYLNSPTNPIFDFKLEECLIKDPIFMKELRTYQK